MFRFVLIASLSGEMLFAHYFESIPHHLRGSLEKEILEKCISVGKKEGRVNSVDSVAVFKREGLLTVVIGAVRTANENIAFDLLHSFSYILVHYLNNKTERQTVTNSDIIHEVLGQMVHGDILETRISHINALRNLPNRAKDDDA